jgi:kynureninase
VIRRAHEAGAVVILDAYQSAGTVPLDVTALGVDFATGGSVKWLCGWPGAAWLYVRPDLAVFMARRRLSRCVPIGRETISALLPR